ncbi:GPP34 family phosphoprotein [Nocardia sp. NBC_01327]|uniref:GPP34 family phosphoprotein n=1 Tax=Nocardia sp. NBC_01327 TaxID=2903593 RepID=UPI002E15DEEF|nr:GPP34 family phosphoprotein [Nocardia sp. NBC_01327]
MTSIADDLLWLLLDDHTGEFLVDRAHVAFALEAAVHFEAATPTSEGTGESLRFAVREPQRHSLEDVLSRLADDRRTCAMPARRFGLFRRWSWPTLDCPGKYALRTSIHRALIDPADSDLRTAVLVALLTAVHALSPQCPGRQPGEVDRLASRVLLSHSSSHDVFDSVRRRMQADYAASFCGIVQPMFQRPRSIDRLGL